MFLVDTGTGRTVIRQECGLVPSGKYLNVRSENGIMTKSPLSRLMSLTDKEMGKIAQLQIVMSPECPVNLLGREAVILF